MLALRGGSRLLGHAGRLNSRCFSATTASRGDVKSWIAKLTSAAPSVSEDRVDINRVSQLARTLPTREKLAVPAEGGHLPLAHHLILFQPNTPQSALAADGSTADFNAPAPFERRMWAGGSFEWPTDAQPIVVGDKISNSVSVFDIQEKKNMIFVQQKHELRNPDGDLHLREIRTHVFRPLAKVSQGDEAAKSVKKAPAPRQTPEFSFEVVPDPPLLFRFSALTFNGHRIHYDRDWAISREGHKDVVVHGPLTALLLVELATQQLKKGEQLRRFEYRATAPLYADGRKIEYCGTRSGNQLTLWAEQGGNVCMQASGTLE